MTFGHQGEPSRERDKLPILAAQKTGGATRNAGFVGFCALWRYLTVSPPSVTLIPARKLNGSAGKPGAGS